MSTEEQPNAVLPGWCDRWGPIATAAVLFTVCLGSSRALTDHEALLAGSAKQMVQSGDWLLLKIGDQPWLEKPALPQWLAASSALAFGGFNEWTMRLPFALSGVLVVWIVMRLMTSLYGREIGLLAGFVQATCVYQVAYARLAESDVMLQVFVLGAIAVFADTEFHRESLSPTDWNRRRLAFWALLGATNLAKGLVFGAVLTLLTCVGWVLLRRDFRAIARWWSPVGMLLAIGIAAAWPLSVVWRDPAVLELWSDHTVGRAAGSLGYTQPFWYYLTTWPTQLLPWTPFLLIGVPGSWRNARHNADSPDRFIWWWMLSQPAVLSLSSGKHHHYLVYALPACSAVIALGLRQTALWLRDEQRSWNAWQIGTWLAAAATVIAGVVICQQRADIGWTAIVIGGLLAGCLMGMALGIGRRNLSLTGASLVALVLAGHISAQAVVLPLRDPSAADRAFLADVESRVLPKYPLIASGCQEIARHIFYLQRPVIGIWEPDEIAGKLPAKAAKQSDWYVIARGYHASPLSTYGRVSIVTQSRYTRRERTPDDRYTLFHIQRSSPDVEQAGSAVAVERK